MVYIIRNDFCLRLWFATLVATFPTMAATLACDFFAGNPATFRYGFACDFYDFDHDFFEKFFKRLYDYYDYWIAWKLKKADIRSVEKCDTIRRYLIRNRRDV